MHAVVIPVPDEAHLGQNHSCTVIKFEQLHLWWHRAAEDDNTVVKAQST